ncbi:MAG: IS3 family transposase [Saezia sp.]
MIKANQAQFGVARMCTHLTVSRSAYYDWLERKPTARQMANCALLERIKHIHQQSDATYGAPRIHAVLRSMGECVNKKRVARLMRLARIQGVSRRRSFIVTTRRGCTKQRTPDLVDRKFVASNLNELWVADMTYLPTWEGFIYLAVVIDVYSRKVVGWSFSHSMTTEVVMNALNMALLTRQPQGVIHHSDQGSQGEFNRSLQHP